MNIYYSFPLIWRCGSCQSKASLMDNRGPLSFILVLLCDLSFFESLLARTLSHDRDSKWLKAGRLAPIFLKVIGLVGWEWHQSWRLVNDGHPFVPRDFHLGQDGGLGGSRLHRGYRCLHHISSQAARLVPFNELHHLREQGVRLFLERLQLRRFGLAFLRACKRLEHCCFWREQRSSRLLLYQDLFSHLHLSDDPALHCALQDSFF